MALERVGVAESDKSALPTVLPAAGEGADDLDIARKAPAAHDLQTSVLARGPHKATLPSDLRCR